MSATLNSGATTATRCSAPKCSLGRGGCGRDWALAKGLLVPPLVHRLNRTQFRETPGGISRIVGTRSPAGRGVESEDPASETLTGSGLVGWWSWFRKEGRLGRSLV